jgi:hypothetical protein
MSKYISLNALIMLLISINHFYSQKKIYYKITLKELIDYIKKYK